MKKIVLLWIAAAAISCATTGVDSATLDDGADTSNDVDARAAVKTLNGEFAWSDRTTGALEAVFEPAGVDVWNVSFYFEFRGKPHTYTGTATGNLENGPLEGRVQNEDRQRTWEFSGTFDGSTYRGEHWELRDDERQPTGTLTLSG